MPSISAYPALAKAPNLPNSGDLRAACIEERDPFDKLDASRGAPTALVNAAAKVCDRCPMAADCTVRVHRRAKTTKKRVVGTDRRRSSTRVLSVVTAFLREHGETTAPQIREATGLSLPSVRNAIHALHTAGRLTKRPAPPGAGNRVFLTLNTDRACNIADGRGTDDCRGAEVLRDRGQDSG